MKVYKSRSLPPVRSAVSAPVFRKDTVRDFCPVHGPAKQKIGPVLILEPLTRIIHDPCTSFECQASTRHHQAQRAVDMLVHDKPLIMAANGTHGLCVHKHAMVFENLMIERRFGK